MQNKLTEILSILDNNYNDKIEHFNHNMVKFNENDDYIVIALRYPGFTCGELVIDKINKEISVIRIYEDVIEGYNNNINEILNEKFLGGIKNEKDKN